MAFSDLAYMGLVELGVAIKARKVSPVEVARAMLERIGTLDTTLVSYATLMTDSAQQEAKAAEDEIGKDKYRGPLHGVPISVKDLCDAKGVVTAAGRFEIAARAHATAYAALRRAFGTS